MRVVLADLKSNRGFVSKDTVVGGYGSRLDPFSRVTSVIAYLKKKFHDVPSVHMAYIAAILARAGHDVKWTRGEEVAGDVALVLSSLVDYKNETAWADRMRASGVKVGFIGITASKMPELFADHCDFIFDGEPEAGVMRLARGIVPTGIVASEPIDDLDSLPFPRDERRRRIARPGDAQEVGTPAHSPGAPARDHEALPRAGHRDRGVLRARVPAGRLELDRGDHRLRHRSRIDVRAVQDPDAVS